MTEKLAPEEAFEIIQFTEYPLNADSIIQELREVLRADPEGVYIKAFAYAEKLIKKYSREECHKVQLFHVLIGGSEQPKTVSPYFDIEGDSIEEFIRSLKSND